MFRYCIFIPIGILSLILVGCDLLLPDRIIKGMESTYSTTFNGITIYANNKVDPEFVKSTIEALKLSEKVNNQYLTKTDAPLSIHLMDEKTFDKEFEDYEYSQGLYYSSNQQIYIRVEDDINDLFYFSSIEGSVQNLVAHEYSHFRISEEMVKEGLEDESIPTWFNEGYCEYVANLVSRKSSPMYDQFSEEIFKSYDALLTKEEWEANSGDYIQALATVREFILVGKNDTIQIIFEDVKQGKEWSAILSDFFKIDIHSDTFVLQIKRKMEDFYTEGILFDQ